MCQIHALSRPKHAASYAIHLHRAPDPAPVDEPPLPNEHPVPQQEPVPSPHPEQQTQRH